MTCPTCATNGRLGYCAPLRCYCAHTDCYAFASWTPLARPLANVQTMPTRKGATAEAWANRQEDSSWIDKL